MAGSQAHEQSELKKGPWSREEDQKLIEYMKRHGERGRWRDVPQLAGLNRCGKSCRLRWINYLRPNIKRGNFSQEEEATIIRLQKVCGNSWAFIATHLPGRTDNEIKNYWYAHQRKKLPAEETPLVTQTLSKHLLAAADSLASTADNIRGCALRLQSDAHVGQLPNLHLQHNPLQRFDYVTPNPQAQLHGLGLNSTDPAQALPNTLPPQGPSFNYQVFHFNSTNPVQALPITLPPQGPTFNYQGFHFNSTDPVQALPTTLPPQGPTFNYQGFHFNSTDPVQALPTTLPPQGPTFNYQGFHFNSTDPVQALPSTLPPQGPTFNYQGFHLNSTDPVQALPSTLPPRGPTFNHHELNFNSTDPAQTLPCLPPQGPNLNYHGLHSISTDTTQALPTTLPPQGPSFDYQAMEDQRVNNYSPHRFGPLIANIPNTGSIPDPRVNNYAADYQFQLPVSTDTAQAFPATLPPQVPSFNYQAMEDQTASYYPHHFGPSIANIPNIGSIPDPQVNNYAANIGSLLGTVPNAGWIPALIVSASTEGSMTNQEENEITPPAEEISNPFSTSTSCAAWPELVMDNETADLFCGDLLLG